MPKENMMSLSYPSYPMESLDAMYPEVYHKCYPMVKQMCEMYDNPSNPGFYPYPNRVAVEQMTDHIYQMMGSMGYPMQRQGEGLLRSLILILLIRELLRRRGSY
ncbi:hypothetical protein [Desulfolucanica intricata]|uniref:hypothetical protein n=1 Tax=Desulfolucanica intricata TaxID=1285191 RepID=UPI0008338AE6|nr:hypothetical protein [Desulfolucanica intricata]